MRAEIRHGGPQLADTLGRPPLGDNFGGKTWGNTFGETPWGNYWGNPLEETKGYTRNGNHMGGTLWGAIPGGIFLGEIKGKKTLGKPNRGTILQAPWGFPLGGTLMGDIVGEPTWGSPIERQIFGDYHGECRCGTTPWGTTTGEAILRNSLETTLGEKHGDPPWWTFFGGPTSGENHRGTIIGGIPSGDHHRRTIHGGPDSRDTNRRAQLGDKPRGIHSGEEPRGPPL